MPQTLALRGIGLFNSPSTFLLRIVIVTNIHMLDIHNRPMPVDVDKIREIRFFKGLDSSLLEHFSKHSCLQTYDTDETIFQEGDTLPACLHLLVAGSLRITRMANTGKETILRLLWADAIFAAPAVFGDGLAPATATAMEPIQVLTIQREALLDGFRQDPELALHLLIIFNQRLQHLHNRVHGLVSERAIVRLIHYLEYAAASAGTEQVPEGEQLRSRLTYYQIARSIGITYEECVRLFKKLKGKVVYERGGKITLLMSTEQFHKILNHPID
jgi:CRP-like cAMP-binding protein